MKFLQMLAVIIIASIGFALATETTAPISVHLLGSFIFGGWIGYVTSRLQDWS